MFTRLFLFSYDFFKIIIIIFFYLSYRLRLLLIVCGDIESSPGSDRLVRVLYFNIRGLHDNLDELAVAGSDYDVLVCAKSKVSDRRHLSELRIPGFGFPQQRLRNSRPSLYTVLDTRTLDGFNGVVNR